MTSSVISASTSLSFFYLYDVSNISKLSDDRSFKNLILPFLRHHSLIYMCRICSTVKMLKHKNLWFKHEKRKLVIFFLKGLKPATDRINGLIYIQSEARPAKSLFIKQRTKNFVHEIRYFFFHLSGFVFFRLLLLWQILKRAPFTVFQFLEVFHLLLPAASWERFCNTLTILIRFAGRSKLLTA